MLPSRELLRRRIAAVIDTEERQGHLVDGLREELEALPDSYDALVDFAHRLVDLPLRKDWPYREPNDLEGIRAQCDPGRPTGAVIRTQAREAPGRPGSARSCPPVVVGSGLSCQY